MDQSAESKPMLTEEQQAELKGLCEDVMAADASTEYKPFDSLAWWLEDLLGEVDSPEIKAYTLDELKQSCQNIIAANGDVDYKDALLLTWALAECLELDAVA